MSLGQGLGGKPAAQGAMSGPQSGPPPKRGTPADPPFGIIAGESDSGKTTDLGYSFPTDLHVAAPGALEPLRATCGYDPDKGGQRVEARSIEACAAYIPQAVEAGYTGVVINDFSFVMGSTYGWHDTSPAAYSDKTGKHNGWHASLSTKADLLHFREIARYCGIRVTVETWLRTPKTDESGFTPGGPDVPAKGLIKVLPPMGDFVARCSKNPARQPWPGVYVVDELALDYITKNRFERLPREMPMNLGEILRYAGYDLPRHPGLPWQEEAVQTAALAMWAAGSDEDGSLFDLWWDKVTRVTSAGVHWKHVRWTMRDALDRVTLWRMAPTAESVKASFGFGLGRPVGAGVGGGLGMSGNGAAGVVGAGGASASAQVPIASPAPVGVGRGLGGKAP